MKGSRREINYIDAGRRAIDQEASALRTLSESLGRGFVNAVILLSKVKGRVICSGIGKSGHVARKVAATLASTGTPAFFIHPTDAAHGDLGMIGPDDALLLFSKSGRALDSRSGLYSEIRPLANYASTHGLPSVLVSENLYDGLAGYVDVVIPMPQLAEAWEPAPTTSTTIQMAIGDALAVVLAERRDFQKSDFLKLHPGGSIGAMGEGDA